MPVTVSEYATDGDMSPYDEKSPHSPEHKDELLGDRSPQPLIHAKLLHTAQRFASLGFNENASMYQHGVHHNYRHYSIDSQESTDPRSPSRSRSGSNKENQNGGGKEKAVGGGGGGHKRRMSFVKKMLGGRGEKGDGGSGEGGEGQRGRGEKG
ncbi:hypothetical protein ACLMJK_008665 [Lecanora helva]